MKKTDLQLQIRKVSPNYKFVQGINCFCQSQLIYEDVKTIARLPLASGV